MDAVNAFNLELFSMIDMKPPISRAKMMSVTKSAIKAIKLYKHVVQIVEKFIKKCRPELKVPGLYVVDSIVRQSRHQFGVDKDVFAPRFLKNFADTFQYLYLCPADDKSKIARVLNLWQKNGVFEMDVIQPLLDMATSSFVPGLTASNALGGLPATHAEPEPSVTSASLAAALPQLHNPDALAAVAQLFQSSQGQELQKMLQNFQQADRPQAPQVPNPVPSAAQHHPHSALSAEQKPSLAKKLLDRFDYDDEPEDVRKNDTNPIVHTPLGAPGSGYGQYPGQMTNVEHFPPQAMGHNSASGNQHYGAPMQHPSGYPSMNDAYAQQSQGHASLRREGRHREHNRRSRSRSGSRSPRRRRSRSTSRSRRSRPRRSRSPEPRSRWDSPGPRSQEERSEREKERERKQKGLPSIKSQTLSVCSTTLWVGQLDKKTQQQDVMSLLEEFGQIESINMIPPRGCAYIVMVHRQDAYRALHKLSRGSFKVNGKPIKIAWALNKGIKTVYKKLWDVDRGVTFIPWSKVKVEELESFKEGGMLDTETLNPEWSDALKDLSKPGVNNGVLEGPQTDGPVATHVQSAGGPAAFPGPMVLSPQSGLPGAPPGFLPSTFNPAQMHPGFPPRSATEESGKDGSGGKGSSSDMSSDSQLGSPVAPMMSPPGPTGLLGPRAGMLPMQRPPGMPYPHLRPFLPPPNMHPMSPQMMPGGLNPMFPREPMPRGFRMRMPHHPMDDFPPHGPPFPPGLPMGPEDGGDMEGRHFRNERPGFGRDRDPGPFGGNGWPRDGPGRRGHFMGRPDRY